MIATFTDLLGNHWVTSFLCSVLLFGSFYGWRRASSYAYYLRSRFRFYSLRSRCVLLVAQGSMQEDDRVFEFFYDLSNKLAHDCSHLDYTAFIRHVTDDMLQGVSQDSRFIEELTSSVKQRPIEFQLLVNDFYDAIWLTIFESSLILQLSELLKLVPFMSSMGSKILSLFSKWMLAQRLFAREFAKESEKSNAYYQTRDIQSKMDLDIRSKMELHAAV